MEVRRTHLLRVPELFRRILDLLGELRDVKRGGGVSGVAYLRQSTT